jgi:hypothetical protein
LKEFLSCRNASRITHFNNHSTKEIRERPTETQSLFDVWLNIKLVVLRRHDYDASKSLGSVPQSDQFVCGSTNEKETTK